MSGSICILLLNKNSRLVTYLNRYRPWRAEEYVERFPDPNGGLEELKPEREGETNWLLRMLNF